MCGADSLVRFEDAAARDVDMGVDQPGKEQAAARVDDIGRRDSARLERLDPRDHVAVEGDGDGLGREPLAVEGLVAPDGLHRGEDTSTR